MLERPSLSVSFALQPARAGLLVLLGVLAACGGGGSDVVAPTPATPLSTPASTTLAVLETTDLHFNVRSYDYFKLAEDKSSA